VTLVHLSTDYIRAKEYFEAILASTSDAICTTDNNGRILYFSPGAEAMLGVAAQKAVGRQAHSFFEGGERSARELMKRLQKAGALKDHEMVFLAAGGRKLHVSMSVSQLKDRAGNVIGTMGISKDITSRVELERRLRELSNRDALTGLHNQRFFQERLAQEARRARRMRGKLSLMMMDLDGFKQVNDTHGHVEGDRILRAFAAAVDGAIRKEVDCAFRFGGDEFVVLMPGLPASKAEKIARRIMSSAQAVIKKSRIGCSWGVATLPASGALRHFVAQADRRMYAMKKYNSRRNGANTHRR
jgi:diguanylate cyclase (GGDEF)-like protein/PAS domain S-box-containing protein